MNHTFRDTVTFAGVGKTYGRTIVLRGVDFIFGLGIIGLFGLNGVGKTTLLRMVATVLAFDVGSIQLFGEDFADAHGRLVVRRRLGYVFQETGFPRGFTAFGFVDYMAILKEWSDRDQWRAEVRRAFELIGLGDIAMKRISVLSGGQWWRFVLAQAMLGQPDLLVLDEPTAGLDLEQRGRLRDVLG